jgi:hypothetical protein
MWVVTEEEEFLELLCADDDFVRAEFEAIIAAEWPDPPAEEPGRTPAAWPPAPARGRGVPVRGRGSPAWPRRPCIPAAAKQRSPPDAWHRSVHDPEAGDSTINELTSARRLPAPPAR